MALYVLKFGGSSVATVERMKNVSEIIANFINNGQRVVVVTSAMQGVTNNLVSMAQQISFDLDREYDAIISCGELVAAGMLARTLQTTGIPAISLSACQCGISANGHFSQGSITEIKTSGIVELLNNSIVPVITGFQGIDKDGNVITLGRGGSDATACALTHFLNADECLVYTDVDGVYTADPRIASNAQIIPEISYDNMLELSFWGAKVLQYQSVEIAKKYQIKLRVLSSFINNSVSNNKTNNAGTIICNKKNSDEIVGIAHCNNFNLVANCSEHNRFIRVNERLCLVPKDIDADGDIDVDVGTITVVGGLETNNVGFLDSFIVPRFIIKRDLSITYVVNQSQVEPGVNFILNNFLCF